MAAVDTSAVPGPRKAAILMVLLGQDVAGRLLGQLPAAAAAKIIREVAQLGDIDPELADRVLEEYFLEAVRPERHRGGSEVARELLAKTGLAGQVEGGIPGVENDPVDRLLRPLVQTSPEVLSATLAKEHCQTAALVLLHLHPVKAARVLRGMPAEFRSEVVLRMTGLGRVRGEILEEVVGGLEERLRDLDAAITDERSADGVERTATILQSMGRGEVRELLDDLDREDPEQAVRLREMIFTFDSLLLADDRGIQELLRLVETKSLALALHGAEPGLMDKFLNNLSERAGAMLREEMEFLGTVRPADQQAARQEIIQQALQLEQDDKLVFNDPEADGAA